MAIFAGGAEWLLEDMDFERGDDGEIVRMGVSHGRSYNIHFERQEL